MGALGSDLTIKDRKLSITGSNPWLIISEGKKEVENLAKKFEPANYPDITFQSAGLEPLRLSWLGGRESDPDELVQSQLSYH